MTAAQSGVRAGNAWTLAFSSMVAAQVWSLPSKTIVQLVRNGLGISPKPNLTLRIICMASLNGTVKFFNETKGFGFITPDGGGKDVFVHATAVERAGMKTLREGQRVLFDTEADARGPKAVNLRAA